MFIYAFAQSDAIIFICTENMGYRFITFSTNGQSSSLAKVPIRFPPLPSLLGRGGKRIGYLVSEDDGPEGQATLKTRYPT